jgi:hypothetical protein
MHFRSALPPKPEGLKVKLCRRTALKLQLLETRLFGKVKLPFLSSLKEKRVHLKTFSSPHLGSGGLGAARRSRWVLLPRFPRIPLSLSVPSSTVFL